ncbi:disease resistance protein Pik-2-like [Phragmites australis]|uniref:disease resistance protein Pik-2-like n=1 Tax=Phragmites australis TaxID=29695 RepID=UPI002D79CFEB|nr:disease resistance protein Pik-2-like [Phragmites australis]XP_062197851.1 disease resistance protein Pik-2-like [Phragmites australis]XP_062197852.1 disease resistance protein Pik-2-like [Phragmites australis]
MADLVVGLARSVVEGALTKAQLAIEEEAKLRQSTQRELVFIAGEFEMMHSFLNVANEERVKNSVVRTWVRQVRDLAYDVEDCIEFVVHLDNEPNWWRRLLPPCMAVAALPLDEAVAEIQQLKARVEDVSRRNSRYSLISDSGSKPITQPQPASSTAVSTTALDMLVEARHTARKQQGLGDLTQLIAKECSDLGVISVWGTGGDLGTTSIIRKAYQDPEICQNFGCRGWVKLTHPFNPHEFLQSLVSQFYTNSCLQEGTNVDVNELKRIEVTATTQGGLIDAFMKQVNEKRYLVVLENVSTMGEWDGIRTYLPDKKNGSWIIVSTQQCEIASLCIGNSYQVLELKQYSAEHSVCVFFKEGSQGHGVKGEEINRVMDSSIEILTHDGMSHRSDFPTSKRKAARDWMDHFYLVERELETNQLRHYIAKARFNAFQVMSLWGIAGVGKTALVRNLYYDRILRSGSSFDMYGWVNVPHPLNLRDFCRNLLSDLHSEPLQSMGIKDPIQECRKILKEHRCLVIIDDLQSTEEWDIIQPALVSRPSGSIIIAITTEASIATHCADNEEVILNVKGLEAEAAFELFQKQVLKKKTSSSITDSKAAELQELILKCGGLPKVIVAIADFLAPKTVTWMDSASSMNRRFMHELESSPEFASLQALFGWMHSYFRTCPDFLKPCIFYLSIFPRDHCIRRRRLVRRWIAEGYSRDSDKSSAEERGECFFSRLLDLSIIQQPPHSVTTAFNDTRMVLCQVNSFIREYIISRQMEENLVFELGGSCTMTTQRSGRHLSILESWDRDRIVFENIEFSRLRSLTVFGKWRSFFISDRMRLLRVLDLENASDVKYKDLKQMMKLLSRLKYLSLRGCTDICRLPSSLGDLRQLETLDVLRTSVVTMPMTITKLKKLQYIRAGTIIPKEEQLTPDTSASPSSSVFCRSRQLDGVEVSTRIGEMTALHTLGVVNVNSAGGRAILKELRKLTQLRKLGLSGINKKNSKEFFSALSGHGHLESLSVRVNKYHQELLDGIFPNVAVFSPPKNLQSLKLYGLVDKLPVWINPLHKLTKLHLEMTILAEDTIRALQYLKLCILRLSIKQVPGGKLDFCVMLHGEELRCYETVKVLEIACSSTFNVTFGSQALQNLELLKAHCLSGSRSQLQFSGLEKLSELKEVQIKGSHDCTLKEALEQQLAMHQKNPVLKIE